MRLILRIRTLWSSRFIEVGGNLWLAFNFDGTIESKGGFQKAYLGMYCRSSMHGVMKWYRI